MFKIPESVLVVIYTKTQQVLLMERAGFPGYWQSVTGSKDWVDEPFIDVAKREVSEETGIVIDHHTDTKDADEIILTDWQTVNQYEIYSIWRHRYAPGVTINTEHVFGLLVPDNIAVTLSPKEHTAYCWLPYREAAKRCFSASNKEAILCLEHHFQ